jgi:hypothetical protein
MEKSHWRLWHLGLKMYVPWNTGRLRSYSREPLLRLENNLWDGGDLVQRVEAHRFSREGEYLSRLTLNEMSNFNYQMRLVKKEPRTSNLRG